MNSISKWKEAHANLSRVLIASLMKKFGFRTRDVARELGITEEAVRQNIRKLSLTRVEIEKYAIGSDVLGKKLAQCSENTKKAAA